VFQLFSTVDSFYCSFYPCPLLISFFPPSFEQLFSSKFYVYVSVYDLPHFFKLLTGIFVPSQAIPTNVAVYRLPEIVSLRKRLLVWYANRQKLIFGGQIGNVTCCPKS